KRYGADHLTHAADSRGIVRPSENTHNISEAEKFLVDSRGKPNRVPHWLNRMTYTG
ncbi:MAG: hypothetical protein ACI8W7_002421, partial [Gammaproteobacteria bacterium]